MRIPFPEKRKKKAEKLQFLARDLKHLKEPQADDGQSSSHNNPGNTHQRNMVNKCGALTF